jgi:ribosomal protein S18 acetylase RimI-like enzyme
VKSRNKRDSLDSGRWKWNMTSEREHENLEVPDSPRLRGLRFRLFHGESDYPAMVKVTNQCLDAIGIDHATSVEDMARRYRHLHNCDPVRDSLIVETNDRMIGYTRVWWEQELTGNRMYIHFIFLLPAWQGRGIERAMIRWNEKRLSTVAGAHPMEISRVYHTWAADSEPELESLLVDEGYKPVRYSVEMVRSNLEDIPDIPLPDGFALRIPEPAEYRAVWNAVAEAFKDHWAAHEWPDEEYHEWLESPNFDPSLWQVVWHGRDVAGTVLTFIDRNENRRFSRKRGYTEMIAVRRPYRRRGLARSLIARSLNAQKAAGMTESALSVDAENISGALHLYRSMGFEVVKRYTSLRKPVD